MAAKPDGFFKPNEQVEISPLAEFFPSHSAADFAAIFDSVQSLQRIDEPILVWSGKLVDGRGRLDVCRKLGYACPYIRLDSKLTESQVVMIVKARNAARRHMTPSQLAMVAAKMTKHLEGGTNSPPIGGESHAAKSAQVAAASVGASQRSTERAVKVLEEAAPEVVAAVAKGEVSIADAAAIAHEPAKKQKAAVKKVRAKKAKTLKAAVKGDSDDGGGYEPHEAKREVEKLKKALSAVARAYGDVKMKIGEPGAMKLIFKGIDDAHKAFDTFQRSFKRMSA